MLDTAATTRRPSATRHASFHDALARIDVATGRLIATSAAYRAFVREYLARPSTAATTPLWRRALARERATAYKAAPGSSTAQLRDAKVAINTLLDCLVN